MWLLLDPNVANFSVIKKKVTAPALKNANDQLFLENIFQRSDTFASSKLSTHGVRYTVARQDDNAFDVIVRSRKHKSVCFALLIVAE